MTATNSIEPAKDGNGNAFNITFAAESVSGNKAQKTYIGEPVGETIITPAQDGTDGTGITAPTGAVGIRGWLSGIYSKLAGSISVTGTFWQATQPISAASLPLPSGAATSALQTTINTTLGSPMQTTGGSVTANAGTNLNTSALALETGGNLASIKTNTAVTAAGASATSGSPVQGMTGGVPLPVSGTFFQTTQPVSLASLPGLGAGSAAIGSIIGRTTMATATPVVTSNGAYAAGNEIGGLMTFPIGGAGSGTLMSVRVTSRSVLTTALKAYIFTTNPSNSTWTDKSATAINAADIASLLAIVTLNAPDRGLGTVTLWNAGAIGEQFVAANLYVVLVVVSAATLTSASTSDITVQLGVSDD
jgi:hypothetical protein